MAGKGQTPETPRAPGWYPDPFSATGDGERYFDGKGWGTSERPRGRHTVSEPRPVTDLGPRRVRSRLRRARPLIGLLVLVGLAVAIVQFRPGSGSGSDSADTSNSAQAAHVAPAPASDEPDHPLGAPERPPAGSGGYEFIEHQPTDANVPVAFDPCRPVHYVVNPAGEPPDGQLLVAQAVARVQRATGLRFVADGTTTEAPDKQRAPYQPGRYDASRWAPVLIAWSDAATFPGLAGYVAGLGSPAPWSTPSRRLAFVSGQVVLDREQLGTAQLSDRGVAEAIILHELGHLVGLDHTADPAQLMYSEAQFNVRDYGPGDLRGLALLGQQACVPEL
jgi:hypothetical protein